MEERERRRRRRRANSDVEETPTPIDSADPGVVPGFCDSASRSPFLSLSLSLSRFFYLSLSLSLHLSTLCCRHFPFASWPRKFHGGSSLHLQLLVPLRPRGCAQEEEGEGDGLYAYLIISTLILGRHLTARIVCAAPPFHPFSFPFSLLLSIYPSCFPWFKGCLVKGYVRFSSSSSFFFFSFFYLYPSSSSSSAWI